MSSPRSTRPYRGSVSPAARDKQHPPPSSSASSASDDPSFSAAHFATSTPNRPRLRSGRPSTDEEEEEGEDLLRASDTESLPEVLPRRSGGVRSALTQRSLAELSSGRNGGPVRGGKEMLIEGAILSFDATVGRDEGSRVRRLSREDAGRVMRAGSGSTGSSTLFEEGSATRGIKGIEVVSTRRRKALEVETVLEEDLDVSPSQSGKAAATRFSPAQLNAFIESKLSPSRNTPPSSTQSRRLPFQTPKAPGSYPTGLSRSATPLTTPSASTQIHDAFNKFITGPGGAINNSAERRKLREREREARATPLAVGRYPFTPRGEREMGRSWSVGARGGAPAEVRVESPSSRLGRKELGLGRTLSILRDSQIESETNRLARDEVDLAGYFAPSEDERDIVDDGRESSEQEEVQGGRGERSTIQFAMADSGSSMDDTEVLDARPTTVTPVVTLTSTSLALSSSAGRALAASLSRRPRPESSPSRRITPPRSNSPPLPPALPSPPTSPVPVPASLPQIRLSTSPRVLDPRSPRSPVTFEGPRHLLASPIPLPQRLGPISSTPPRSQKLSSSSSAFSSNSPSRTPRSSSYRVSPTRVESVERDHTVLQSLAKDLLVAVQSLSSLAPSVPAAVGIPELSRSLARIRGERRADWDKEKEEFEAQASLALKDRDEIWRVLEKEREEEGRLALRFEDLRKGIEEMGNRVSVSVAAVVEESIRVESKKRSFSLTWISILFLFTLWGLMRYSNSRAQTLYQTTYYDPFHPALFLPPSSHFSLLPETLRTFSIDSMQPDERIWETRIASLLEWGTREVGSLRDRLAVVRA